MLRDGVHGRYGHTAVAVCNECNNFSFPSDELAEAKLAELKLKKNIRWQKRSHLPHIYERPSGHGWHIELRIFASGKNIGNV